MTNRARVRWTTVLLAALVAFPVPGRGGAEATPGAVDADRWLELELGWFKRREIERSTRDFWKRVAPLYEDVAGTKGLILDVGGLVDPVLHWGGDLEAPVPLSRIPVNALEPSPWTYADIARLAATLRQTGARRHGLDGVKVGLVVTGRESALQGSKARFALRHPEAFRGSADGRAFDPGARLEPDGHRYGAYPDGIADGLTAGELFAAQWGSLSRALGLDAVVLRDGMLMGVAPRRGAADLVRHTRRANPQALVIGFSSTASAIAEQQLHADLEAISTHLDAFVDQTRDASPDGRHDRSGTHELSRVLLHAAILADTPTRHYVHVEAIGAAEGGDGPPLDRVRWGIWALHHAALRRPGELRMPRGTYVSWGGRATPLPTEGDVDSLAESLDDAIRDARATREIYGPTLVYNPAGLEGLAGTGPSRDIGARIDDIVGTVMQWPVPILSVARIEDLTNLDLELPIVQTPVHLGKEERALLLDRMVAGRPMAVVGSPAGGLDEAIARAAGLETSDSIRGAPRHRAAVLTPVPQVTDGLPQLFDIAQPFTRNVAGRGTTVVHAVDGSPTLVLNLDEGRRVLVWDPPALASSLYPSITVARVLSLWLRGGRGPRTESIEPDQPTSFAAWRLADGSRRLLLGRFDGKIGDSPAVTKRLEISLPARWTEGRALRAGDVWGGGTPVLHDDRVTLTLEENQSRLIEVR